MNTEGNTIPAAGGVSGREGEPGAADLTGQVAVVTGASRGIGQAIAIRLAGVAQASSSTTRETHQAPPKRSRRSKPWAPRQSTSAPTCQSLPRPRRPSRRRAAASAASTSSRRTPAFDGASALCWTSRKPIMTACSTSMPRARSSRCSRQHARSIAAARSCTSAPAPPYGRRAVPASVYARASCRETIWSECSPGNRQTRNHGQHSHRARDGRCRLIHRTQRRRSAPRARAERQPARLAHGHGRQRRGRGRVLHRQAVPLD